jgi:hypothetical protein
MNKLVSTLVATLALTLSPAVANATPGANGTVCTASGDCTSGFCVDNVCCNALCDGQCEACSVAGSLGACTPVVGAPHGTRAVCSDGAGSLCAAKTCDGTARTACMGFKNGATVVCAAASCTGGFATVASHCDGAGFCPGAIPASCAPYACDAAACKTACAADADCATGYACSGGKCARRGSTCSADGTTAIAPDGQTADCRPYKCGTSGTCNAQCASDTDCSSPNVCDTASRSCKDPNDKGLASPGQSTSGGCAIDANGVNGANGGSGSTLALAFGALLGIGLAGRRRARTGRNG